MLRAAACVLPRVRRGCYRHSGPITRRPVALLHIQYNYYYVSARSLVASLLCVILARTFLARDVIYTSRAYAMMPVSVCLSVCLCRKCIGAL